MIHAAVILAASIFSRGDLVVHTNPSPGLTPSAKSNTITAVDPVALTTRGLLFYPAFEAGPRIILPAFDAHCSLSAVRSNSGNYEVVDISADGIVTSKFRVPLIGAPSRLFIDAQDIYYVSLAPIPQFQLPYDLLILKVDGSEIARIDFPDANGVNGFDVAGCNIIYSSDLGVSVFNRCDGSTRLFPLPIGRPADVRYLPGGEMLVIVGAAVWHLDANGNLKESFDGGDIHEDFHGIAVAPDAQSFWAGRHGLFHFALDGKQTAIARDVFVPGATISFGAITICGDWRVPPARRRAAAH